MGELESHKNSTYTRFCTILKNRCAVHKIAKINRRQKKFLLAAESSLQVPIDRTLQALVTPLLATASHIYVMHDTFCKKYQHEQASKLAGFGYLALRAVVLIPNVAAKTICIWIPLTVNTVVHFIPFKVISACRDNRPENFFKRRQNTRHVQRQPLNALFSSLWSADRTLALEFDRAHSRNPFLGFEENVTGREQRVLQHEQQRDELGSEVSRLRDGVPVPPPFTELKSTVEDRLLRFAGVPLDAQREVYLNELENFFWLERIQGFTEVANREQFKNNVQKILGLAVNWGRDFDDLDPLLYFEGCESHRVFFLPGDVNLVEEQEEIQWRFEYFLAAFDEVKMAVLSHVYKREEKDHFLSTYHQVVIRAYKSLLGPPQATIKSAVKINC